MTAPELEGIGVAMSAGVAMLALAVSLWQMREARTGVAAEIRAHVGIRAVRLKARRFARRGTSGGGTPPRGPQAAPLAFDASDQKTLSALNGVVSREGIEPSTRRLRVCCSAN
jgi:hypothetical protein